MADVSITPEAYDEFDRLPKKVKTRIMKVVERLGQWPDVSGVKQLSGNLAGWYRIRTGDYRIRFRLDKKNVVVDKIGHRKDVYEE